MATRTVYYAGGLDTTKPAQNRAEVYDGAAGTFTSWNAAGVQTAQRGLTAGEAAALAAEDAVNTSEGNKTTLTAQATAAIVANDAWIATVAPQVQAAVDAIQAKAAATPGTAAAWPSRAQTAPTLATLAAVQTQLGLIYDNILAPLVQQNATLSQAVETMAQQQVATTKQLDVVMRLVAGALDSTSGT